MVDEIKYSKYHGLIGSIISLFVVHRVAIHMNSDWGLRFDASW